MTDEELRQLFDNARQENAAAHEQTRTLLQQEIAKSAEDTKRVMRRESEIDHENTRGYFEVTRNEMQKAAQLVAEGVLQVNQRVDRLEKTIERTAAETQAMIKFSYAELDRRIASLEERVDRLENGRPH